MDMHIYTTNKTAQIQAQDDLKDAHTALIDNTKWSKSVLFISAYYGIDFASDLFRICKNAAIKRDITLIFAAASNSNRSAQVDELSRLRDLLIESGHAKKRIDIRIATNITFLHTKYMRLLLQVVINATCLGLRISRPPRFPQMMKF